MLQINVDLLKEILAGIIEELQTQRHISKMQQLEIDALRREINYINRVSLSK